MSDTKISDLPPREPGPLEKAAAQVEDELRRIWRRQSHDDDSGTDGFADLLSIVASLAGTVRELAKELAK